MGQIKFGETGRLTAIEAIHATGAKRTPPLAVERTKTTPSGYNARQYKAAP